MADATTTHFVLTKPEVGASLDSWGGKLNTNFDRLDVLARGFFTAGGTANAITITTGLSLTAIPTGMKISFVATADNTGATTINVDGIGAQTAQTIRGTALPAEYIMSGKYIEAQFTGSVWRVRREPDVGTDGTNGQWERREDGSMICRATIGTPAGGSETWTYAKEFSSAPQVVATARNTSADAITVMTGAPAVDDVVIYTRFPSGLPASLSISAVAFGRWYS